MNKNEILPLGTVVLLKGATKKLMISGYYPIDEESKKLYDYAACIWPVGYLDSKTMIVFDSDAIEKICFEGYSDDEQKKFIDGVKKFTLNELKKRERIEKEEDFTYIDNKK